MTAAPAPLARIDLARDARHALGWPAILILAGILTAAVGAGVGLALAVTPLAVVAGAMGAVVAAIGIWIAVRVRSLKLAVEVDYLHLTGIRVDRRYHLARGDLSRVATSGPRGASLRTRPSALGFGVGRTVLGTGEAIEVIRLGATPSVILVPTEKGRVAVAPVVEADLIQALLSAAQTRAERGPVDTPTAALLATTAMPATAEAPATPAVQPSAAAGAPPAPAVTAAGAVMVAAVVPPPRPPEPVAQRPRPLTGIERMALEEQMAQQHQASLIGPRSDQAAAGYGPAAAAAPMTSTAAAAPPAARATPFFAPAVVAPSAPPAAMPAPAAPNSAATAAAVAAAVARPARTRSFPLSVPRGLPRRRPPRPMAWRATRPTLGREIALLAIPLLTAGVVWFVAALTGASTENGGLDPLNFALLLCGPIAVLAIFLARARWPRLAALSSLSAVLALALVARAVIG